MTDNINEELSAALTKLTETEYQVKTAKETMSLAMKISIWFLSRIMRERQIWWMYSPHNCHGTQAHTNLINAYLSEKMAVAEYRKVISE